MKLTDKQSENLSIMHKINYDMLDEIDKLSEQCGFKYYLAFGTLLGAVRHKDHIPWDDDADIIMTYTDYLKLLSNKEKLDSRFKLIDPDDFGKKYYNFVPHIADTKAVIAATNAEKASFYKGVFLNNPYLDIFFVVKSPEGFRGKIYKFELMVLYAMAGAYRLPSLSTVKSPYMKIARFILESVGKLFSAQKIRNAIKRLMTKYDGLNNYVWLVANGEMSDFKCVSADAYDETVNVIMGDKHYKAPKGYKEVLRVTYGDYMKLPDEDKRVPEHYTDVRITE